MSDSINWLNNIQSIVMVLLTLVYVVATICIYRANKKSAKAAQDVLEQNNQIQKQNIDIQLFNDRFALYKNIESMVIDKCNNILDPYELLEKTLDNVNYNRNIQENMLRVRYLYSKCCLKQLRKVLDLVKILTNIQRDIRYLYDWANSNQRDFAKQIESFNHKYGSDEMSGTELEEFKKICLKNRIHNVNENKLYNYYEIYSEIESLNKELDKEKELLFKIFEEEMEIGKIS